MTELAVLSMIYQAELIKHAVDAEDALDRLRITFGAASAAAALERSQTSMLSLREAAVAEFAWPPPGRPGTTLGRDGPETAGRDGRAGRHP